MNNQEAIRLIRNHPTMCEFPDAYGKPYYEAVDMAISALEKQIPKKPEQPKIPRYGMGYEYYDWCCPTCGRFLAFESSKGDHHCTCGQAIDWTEGEG